MSAEDLQSAAAQQLRYHAGYVDPEEGLTEGKAIFDALENVKTDLTAMVDIRNGLDDVLNCIEVLNLNENFSHEPNKEFDKKFYIHVSSTIVEIISEIQKTALVIAKSSTNIKAAEELNLLNWRIMCAWGAFFDGDIEDIREHVLLEEECGELE